MAFFASFTFPRNLGLKAKYLPRVEFHARIELDVEARDLLLLLIPVSVMKLFFHKVEVRQYFRKE